MAIDDRINDLEAKKRDHKIMITDEAIEKVPYIKYKCIPEEQYEILQAISKEVLRIAKEENDSNEVAITYSMDILDMKENESREHYYGIALGTEHSVDPEEDTASYHILNGTANCVVVILHNHPSLSKLSLSDVQFLLQYRTMKMIVSVTNLGGVSYLVKDTNYDRSSAIELFNEAYEMDEKAVDLKGKQKAADYFLNNCSKAGLIHVI